MTFSGTKGEVRGCALQRSSIHYSHKRQKPLRQIGVKAINLTPKLRFFEQPSSREICLCRRRGFGMSRKIGTESILQDFSPPSRKNIEVTNILHQLHGFSQVSPKKNGRLRQLKKLINQRKLSESLEVLEKSGISGDFALFILQNIQTLEVA